MLKEELEKLKNKFPYKKEKKNAYLPAFLYQLRNFLFTTLLCVISNNMAKVKKLAVVLKNLIET